MAPEPVGGALNFKHFLKDELMPKITAEYNVNPTELYLFGHSLAGLFSLWTYLTDPSAFSKYVAVSPSIWWNNHELLQLLQQEASTSPPLAIFVGGEEGDMVDDAITVYNNRRCYAKNTFFHIAMNENHASVIPTTISKALRFYTEAHQTAINTSIK